MTQASRAGGVLAVWTDCVAEHEADFNDWYNRQHVPERVGVPGFINGARHRAVRGDRAYFAIYEVESPAVLTGPAYMERLNNPTEWTRAVMPSFKGLVRAVCTIRHREGAGRGAVAATLRLSPRADAREALAEWLIGTAAPAVAALPDVVSVLFLQAEPDAPGPPTAEGELREGDDGAAEWIVVVEGTETPAVEQALADHLSHDALAAAGAAPGVQEGLYRLLYSLNA